MGKYAAKSKVSVSNTKREIETLISKYGAGQFFTAWDNEKETAIVGFSMDSTVGRVCIRLNAKIDLLSPQTERSSWRALLLCIKAKLEAVFSGIETLEQAFFAHIVLPDNRTVFEHASPHVLTAYTTGKAIALLPGI